MFNRACCSATIVEATILVPCHGIKSQHPLHSQAACTQPCWCKYTQPCSLFSRGTAVWTMGARLWEQWGTAVWTMGHGCVQVPGCVEGHPWNSPHRGPVMWKVTPCDGFIMNHQLQSHTSKIKFIPHRKIKITIRNYGEKLEYIYIFFAYSE